MRHEPSSPLPVVAVITGASRGLGAGIARAFASAGIRLGLCARNRPALPDGASGVCEAVDVTDAPALERFARRVEEELGPVDLWVNNAGLLEPVGPLRGLDLGAFGRLIDVNLMGTVSASQVFVRQRRARSGGGVLVNISSGAALSAYPGWSAYCASKAAVDRFSEALALEEADSGLRVHALAPGVVDTDMQSVIRSTSEEDFPMLRKFIELKENGLFNSSEFVAKNILDVYDNDGGRYGDVVLRVPNEWEQ